MKEKTGRMDSGFIFPDCSKQSLLTNRKCRYPDSFWIKEKKKRSDSRQKFC
jgi:hypothetical protein